jgi:hypothetical protein
MLADVVKQQKSKFGSGRPSLLLMNEVRNLWREEREFFPPTLVEQKETWQEFWLYASDTKNWCPRACAIKALFPVTSKEPTAEDLWNFGQGKAYHRLFQEDMLLSLGDRFLGSWERFEKQKDSGLYLKQKLPESGPSDFGDGEERSIVNPWASKPLGNGWRYVEPKIRMLDYRIVVKLDGIVLLPDYSDSEIFELKTAKQQMRDNYDPLLGGSPRPEYIEQVNLGMWATGLKRARIVFLFKGDFQLAGSTVEHEIEYDETVVDRLKGMATKCVDAVRLCDEIKADNPNDEPIFESDQEAAKWLDDNFQRLGDCPMKSKGKARYCPCRDACFPGRGKKRK